MKTTNIMLDLETLGSNPGAAVVAIGACSFSSKGIGDTYYNTIDPVSAVAAGLTIEPENIKWWLKQSDEARKDIFEAKNKLDWTLFDFSSWLGRFDAPAIWGNGATFDNVLLREAYKRAGIKCPWHYHQDRCYRTLARMGKCFNYRVPPMQASIKHNALDDAKTQAFIAAQLLEHFNVEDHTDPRYA